MGKKLNSIVTAFMIMMLYSASALAATTNTVSPYSGADALRTLENIIYGPWGVLIGIVLFIAAILSWLKFGAGTGIVVMFFAVLIFVVPALIEGAQQWGASHAGYTQSSGSNGA